MQSACANKCSVHSGRSIDSNKWKRTVTEFSPTIRTNEGNKAISKGLQRKNQDRIQCKKQQNISIITKIYIQHFFLLHS
uniref:Uncharacterized protein n=1 Tax=Onchocerca volvulus TaxID=6282 RepID=A0A8R1TTK3_ONCVO